ncbi:MAG: RNA polymerase sigma factor [bacterium]|nr:RNA polymerase sigma factor [bacterium]
MLDGENKIIKDAIGGEASSFGLLYEYYQPRIYRFIYLKVSNREEAEDLTHQTFLKAWLNLKTYTNRGYPFGSYLYRIARNLVIDFYRTKKETQSIEFVAEENIVLASSTAINALETKMATANIRSVLLKLKAEYQEIIILKYVEDMTNREIALALEKSEGAIKLMHNRAMKALKVQLITNNL